MAALRRRWRRPWSKNKTNGGGDCGRLAGSRLDSCGVDEEHGTAELTAVSASSGRPAAVAMRRLRPWRLGRGGEARRAREREREVGKREQVGVVGARSPCR